MNINWHNFNVAEPELSTSLHRIVSASQQEILSQGILTFRTQNVARQAQCNISMIYRHFEDRDDLIVSTLGLMFNKLQHEYVDECILRLSNATKVTPELLIQLMPNLDDIEASENGRLWLMAIALSTESTKLRNAIAETIDEVLDKWQQFFEQLAVKIGSLDSLDLRVYQMILRMNFLYYNSLFGSRRVTDAEYKDYLTELLTRPNSTHRAALHPA